ncbi:TPA: hypothetical protein NKB37_002981 [Vibrio parahaemolyticus]|nr:hypothetical protein [Vibrio alginolyticus]HCG9061887.1 hypothetical protein [Vibrio parahaemolyticus]
MTKFTHKSEISKCGTELVFKSYYNDIPCKNTKIFGHLAKRRSGLQLILSDICECLDMFELITFDGERRYTKFLYKAFVITYGKCFAGGEERGVSLNAKAVFKGNKQLLEKYIKIIEARNKYVAHSDSTNYENSAVYLASFDGEHEIFVPTQKYSHPVSDSIASDENMVIYVYEYLNDQIQKLDNAMLQQQA